MLLFIRAPFYVCSFSLVCYVFWLFWLSCQYLPSYWLARLLWGSITVVRRSTKPRMKSVNWWLSGLLYSFIVLLHDMFVLSPRPYVIYFIVNTFVARYSVFVLKVPLNTNETNKQEKSRRCLGPQPHICKSALTVTNADIFYGDSASLLVCIRPVVNHTVSVKWQRLHNFIVTFVMFCFVSERCWRCRSFVA